jgi:hypothetical protein
MTSFDSDRTAEIHRQLHSHLPSEPALRVKTLDSALVEKCLLDSPPVDAWVEAFTEEIGPKRGACRRRPRSQHLRRSCRSQWSGRRTRARHDGLDFRRPSSRCSEVIR